VVVCEKRAHHANVIPTMAVIRSASILKCVGDAMDSRFRRNDQCLETSPMPMAPRPARVHFDGGGACLYNVEGYS
jgi:hypothetical protein